MGIGRKGVTVTPSMIFFRRNEGARVRVRYGKLHCALHAITKRLTYINTNFQSKRVVATVVVRDIDCRYLKLNVHRLIS